MCGGVGAERLVRESSARSHVVRVIRGPGPFVARRFAAGSAEAYDDAPTPGALWMKQSNKELKLTKPCTIGASQLTVTPVFGRP
jgi:hypothetical protein